MLETWGEQRAKRGNARRPSHPIRQLIKMPNIMVAFSYICILRNKAVSHMLLRFIIDREFSFSAPASKHRALWDSLYTSLLLPKLPPCLSSRQSFRQI